MIKHFGLRLFLICGVLPFLSFAFLNGCSRKSGQTAAPDENRRFLIERLTSDPSSLDPVSIVDVDSAVVASKIFRGLVRLDEKGSVTPDTASKVIVSEDGLTYRFQLRKDIFFHDGTPLQAIHVSNSLKRLKDSPRAWILDPVKSIDVQNSDVVIRMSRRFAPFLSQLTMTNAFISKPSAAFDNTPAGTGPFKLEQWQRGSHIKLSAVGFGTEKPHIKGIIYRILPEDFTASVEFDAGRLDIFQIPAQFISRYMNSPKYKRHIHTSEPTNTYYMGFNCSEPPFDDPQIRRAAASALDTASIASLASKNAACPASAPVPPLVMKYLGIVPAAKRYDKNVPPALFSSMAKAFSPTLYFPSNKDYSGISEVIQWYFKKAGLNVKLKALEWNAYKDALSKKEADMFLMSWWADYSDPENFLVPPFHSRNIPGGSNRCSYSNSEVDRILDEAVSSLDEMQRKKLYREAAELIMRDTPWIPLWHKQSVYVTQPWIKNFRPPLFYNCETHLEITKE